MSDNYKSESRFRVVGQNNSNNKLCMWFFPTLEEAKQFCETLAQDTDSEYDILQYLGTMRQAPAPVRPVEWIDAQGSNESSSRMAGGGSGGAQPK